MIQIKIIKIFLVVASCLLLLFIVAIFGAHFQANDSPDIQKQTANEVNTKNIQVNNNEASTNVDDSDENNTDTNNPNIENNYQQIEKNEISGNDYNRVTLDGANSMKVNTHIKAGDGINLQMSCDADITADGVIIIVTTNLPDGVELSAETTNIDAVKKELGITDNSHATDKDKYSMLIERTYNDKAKDFVKSGVAYFNFKNLPKGEITINVTMPILRLQSAAVRKVLGEKGENLNGDYVVYLSEFDDKTISYKDSFIIE